MTTRELTAIMAATIQAGHRAPGATVAVEEAWDILCAVDAKLDLPYVGAPVRGEDPFGYEADCAITRDPDGYPEPERVA